MSIQLKALFQLCEVYFLYQQFYTAKGEHEKVFEYAALIEKQLSALHDEYFHRDAKKISKILEKKDTQVYKILEKLKIPNAELKELVNH